MTADGVAPRALPPFSRRWVPVVGLLLLSPVCAEYLIGYDESIGRPLQLLAGLLMLGPLYGAVAVLIREITRRAGRGWPTILLLSAVFGLIQAGLIDQSLFHLDFDADDPGWATEQPGTLIPGLGIDAGNLLNFVAGHVIWSFAAPIAVVEACAPRLAVRPWLGRPGIAVMVVLYLLGAGVIFSDVVETMATPAQLVGTVVVTLALAVVAFVLPRWSVASPGRVLPWWLVGCCALAILGANQLIPMTWSWLGVGLNLLLLVLLGGLLLLWSGRALWGHKHVLAVAGAALLARAGLSFVVEPLGNSSYTAKYAVNTVITLGVLVLLAWAYYQRRRTETTTRSNGDEAQAASPKRAPGSKGS